MDKEIDISVGSESHSLNKYSRFLLTPRGRDTKHFHVADNFHNHYKRQKVYVLIVSAPNCKRRAGHTHTP